MSGFTQFNADPKCPKCGSSITKLAYTGDAVAECLKVTCDTCGYVWRMLCKGATQ